MSHFAQRKFCSKVKQKFSNYFENKRVLEIGSRDVNGSVRNLFENCDYIGIDAVQAAGVDQVCLGHEFNDAPNSFDVVCAVEVFEHDPYAKQTVANMLNLLRPGGLFFMTCAGQGRPEHGTTRTGPLYGPDADFYCNVSSSMFLEWVQDSPFEEIFLQYNRESSDLYCFAIKENS
ncbi:MAG: methyltransferase domain-containing protein [Planctomycetaceae bacterium]|nr:methyltransferase domain-containing protein [Planctomycetaceae bacterium]